MTGNPVAATINKKIFPDMKHSFYLCCFLLMEITHPLAIQAEGTFENYLSSSNYNKVKVKEILGTDTIKLESGETIKLIGLKGIEAPRKNENIERNKYGFVIEPEAKAETPLEEKAIKLLEDLLKDKWVRLEFDVERINNQFTTLAYVFLISDNTFINEEILRQGYALLQIQPPNFKYADTLRTAYKEAREEKRGLHGE